MSTPEERLRIHARARMFGSKSGEDNNALRTPDASRDESPPTQAWRDRKAEERRRIMASLNESAEINHDTPRDRNEPKDRPNAPSNMTFHDTQVARGRTLSRQYAQVYANGPETEPSRPRDDSARSNRTVTPESYAAGVRKSQSRDPFRADSSSRLPNSELESGAEDLRRREWLDRLGVLNPFTTHTMHPSTWHPEDERRR